VPGCKKMVFSEVEVEVEGDGILMGRGVGARRRCGETMPYNFGEIEFEEGYCWKLPSSMGWHLSLELD
jgi:hypothetical protein